MSRDSKRLPAPAPVPLRRLYPLDALLAMRDEAARRVEMYQRQVERLSNPAPVKQRTPPRAQQDFEEPSPARSRMLIGY